MRDYELKKYKIVRFLTNKTYYKEIKYFSADLSFLFY